uniref:PEPxxWA-CTERM sorting domain-containing protein n=1 Tax=uncultured Caulobacter sp. TaxID=158749 RepID=UPI0025F163FB|nr:PEPxxWA-CTERM sorting domain-containing protein [uncultured Caulobacter sp.]
MLDNYVADGSSTFISFILKSSTNTGNNDPLLDGIVFARIGTTNTPGAVPEPATWAMMLAGFGLLGGELRRRRASLERLEA